MRDHAGSGLRGAGRPGVIGPVLGPVLDPGAGRDPARVRGRLATLPGPNAQFSLQLSLQHSGGTENTDLYITDTEVHGTAGCTSFSGPVTVFDAAITFGTLDVDRSACKGKAAAPRFGDVDWVYDLLDGELSLQLAGRDLTLRDPATGRGVTFAGDSAVEMAERKAQSK